ncbi:unnamed protein product [Rhodiola kirilowii]
MTIEISSNGVSPRFTNKGSDPPESSSHSSVEINLQESASSDHGNVSHFQFQSTSALEILRECVRILRFNLSGFMSILTLLICPVAAASLSNVFVSQSLVKTLTLRLITLSKFTGPSLGTFVEQLCHKLSEMAVSLAVCFPLYLTLSLLSKAAVVYAVDLTYIRKEFDSSKFGVLVSKIWMRVVSTYLWAVLVVAGCFTGLLVLLIAICNLFVVFSIPTDWIIYPLIALGLAFCVVFANAIVVSKVGIVTSVLEDVSGAQALAKSWSLISGQTQVGVSIFLGSTIGMAFVEELFEHRVNTLSYGDGSSRLWEGPLLVIMYSFVVLVDSMMNAVFYFSCRSHSLHPSDEEEEELLQVVAQPTLPAP